MIINYINTIAKLEKKEGKLASMIGILGLLIMVLIGLGIAMFGLHIMSQAGIKLLEAFNDMLFK